VEAFLTHLAVQGKVAASTQNQALNAIVFLYRQVLKKELGWLERVERAKKPARLPVVFTHEEMRAVLALGRDPMGDGEPLVRLRIAAHGVHPAARQGRGLRPTPAHRPGREGRQGPHHHAPGSACRAVEDARGEGRCAP
jgi:hypothetical protein